VSSRPGPPREAFTAAEWAVIQRCRTPEQVQRFLNRLPYNREQRGETLRSFREVIRRRTAHCFEAALAAAVIMEQHGMPPLVVSFESQDNLDHVIFVFRRQGRWGSVARSRDAGLHGRRPVFRTIRDLAWSYFDPYVDFTGRLTGYQFVDLRGVGDYDWRFNPKDMWKMEKSLIDIPHRPMRSSDRRYRQLRARYTAFRRLHPTGPVIEIYSGRERWLPLPWPHAGAP
jgi:hypothetical protein